MQREKEEAEGGGKGGKEEGKEEGPGARGPFVSVFKEANVRFSGKHLERFKGNVTA